MGATAFSEDPSVRGAMNVIRLVKANGWVWNELREACDLDPRHGRRRQPGHWELVTIAFVVSDYIDVQPFYDETTEDLWVACGFTTKPSYHTTHRRLRELEGVADAFLNATGALIRRARSQDPRVMAHVHFDNTEDETHAALVHDCDPDACPHERTARRPARQDTKAFRRERHAMAAMEPEEAEKQECSRQPDKRSIVVRDGVELQRVKIGTCWYLSRDVDAGTRAYMGARGARRFWHGYYSAKAVDHFTGGAIPLVDSASRSEHAIFSDHYDLVVKLAGAQPETAIGDRGLSIASAFEKCTANGTAPIFSWRAGGRGVREDKETHDRHGVPRCKHCGAPSTFVRFSAKRGARIWFDCMGQATPACAKTQSIACKLDYRLLVPLWRTDPLYHELKESHSQYEGTHDYWRDRYKVGADDIGVRPKICGLGFHRLRANAASFVEWLRICHREGWLGTPRRNTGAPKRAFKATGENIAVRLANLRARVGLMGAYGDAAFKVGHGLRTPPSNQPRGGPPEQIHLDIPF
jgi:hypothetical protein